MQPDSSWLALTHHCSQGYTGTHQQCSVTASSEHSLKEETQIHIKTPDLHLLQTIAPDLQLHKPDCSTWLTCLPYLLRLSGGSVPCNALKIRCYTANTNSLPLGWVLPDPVLEEKRLLQSALVLFRPISSPASFQNNSDSLRKETLIFKEDKSLQVHLINHCGHLSPRSSLLPAMLHALVQGPISLSNSITCLHE